MEGLEPYEKELTELNADKSVIARWMPPTC